MVAPEYASSPHTWAQKQGSSPRLFRDFVLHVLSSQQRSGEVICEAVVSGVTQILRHLVLASGPLEGDLAQDYQAQAPKCSKNRSEQCQLVPGISCHISTSQFSLEELDVIISDLSTSTLALPGDAAKVASLRASSYTYLDKYAIWGDSIDLEQAGNLQSEIISTCLQRHADIATAYFDLALISYLTFYQTIWHTDDGEGELAICNCSRTAAEVPKAPKLSPSPSSAVSNLEHIILLIQNSVNTDLAQYPYVVVRFAFLGACYLQKFKMTGSDADRSSSIQAFRAARRSAITGHPSPGTLLRQLGAAQEEDYLKTNSVHNLDLAIHDYSLALKAAPELRQAKTLLQLGRLCLERAQILSSAEYMSKVVQFCEQGLEIATEEDLDTRRHLAVTVCWAYKERAEHSLNIANIDKAIATCEEALAICSLLDKTTHLLTRGLGMFFRYKYIRTGEEKYLQLSISKLQSAFNMCRRLGSDIATSHSDPTGCAERALTTCWLASTHLDQFWKTKNSAYIDSSIQLLSNALRDFKHPYNPFLGTMARAYWFKYTVTKSPTDLQTAIKLIDDALDRVPHDHPTRTTLLHESAIFLLQDDASGSGRKETAIRQLGEALYHTNAPPLERIEAGRTLFALCHPYHGQLAARVIKEVASLVPLASPLSLENSDRQYIAEKIAGLASQAATSITVVERALAPYDAINALEMSRGIMRISINTLRGDLSKLQEYHPQLATKLVRLREKLDIPRMLLRGQSSPKLFQPSARVIDGRLTASQQLEQVLQDIRQLTGFERFLLPPPEQDVIAATVYGPIVVLNISHLDCQAFIIDGTEVKILRLWGVSVQDLEVRVRDLQSDRSDASDERYALLEWLWQKIVDPVLNVLKITGPPGASWPRICWILTGLLAKLPIHAAGMHLSGGSETLMDRAISTYGASLSTVVESRLHSAQASNLAESSATIAFVNAQADLHFVYDEISQVSEMCKSAKMHVLEPRPILSEVVEALENCDIFHFAGHGRSASDPSQSALVLKDRVLTVAALFNLNLVQRKPLLAYLSACSTGHIQNEQLVDEGFHLIAACQLAGFQNVIGTLWDVKDAICLEVATKTYEWIITHGVVGNSVAEGLHFTCRELRDQWVEDCNQNYLYRGNRTIVEAEANPDIAWIPFILYSN